MLTLRKIAITGGIASGKSTVCRLFQELGAYVISADNIVHELLTPQTEIGKKVIALLGNEVVVDGTLNKKAIALKVFRNHHLLENLEKLLHPEVQRKVEAQYNHIKKYHPCSLFVAEIPLLFESQQTSFYDVIIVVVADRKKCVERFKQKTLSTEEDYENRDERLLPLEMKKQKANFVIENNGDLEELKTKVMQLHCLLTETSS